MSNLNGSEVDRDFGHHHPSIRLKGWQVFIFMPGVSIYFCLYFHGSLCFKWWSLFEVRNLDHHFSLGSPLVSPQKI